MDHQDRAKETDRLLAEYRKAQFSKPRAEKDLTPIPYQPAMPADRRIVQEIDLSSKHPPEPK